MKKIEEKYKLLGISLLISLGVFGLYVWIFISGNVDHPKPMPILEVYGYSLLISVFAFAFLCLFFLPLYLVAGQYVRRKDTIWVLTFVGIAIPLTWFIALIMAIRAEEKPKIFK